MVAAAARRAEAAAATEGMAMEAATAAALLHGIPHNAHQPARHGERLRAAVKSGAAAGTHGPNLVMKLVGSQQAVLHRQGLGGICRHCHAS